MDLVLGVDGGQTSCKCLLATSAGNVLGRGEGGPLIHLAAEGGPARLEQSLRAALDAAWRSAGLPPQSVAAIGLGLTGVTGESAEAQMVLDRVPRIVEARRTVVQSDAFAALAGAHVGQPGVVVVAGTGSIVLGMNARGQTARAGGWGWLVGDEGSACAIGRDALLAAFYARDGAGPATLLSDLLLAHFGVGSPEDIKRQVYAPDFGQRGFAALAPLVSQAAASGDAVSAEIVEHAGRALARQAGAVLRRLDFPAAPVAHAGGAFDHVSGLLDSFRSALQTAFPTVRPVAPQLPPVYGAVIMALQTVTPDWTAAIENLNSSLASSGASS